MKTPKFDMGTATLSHLPMLRGVALRLCKNRDHANDLVQETIWRAIQFAHKFKLGTNLPAWLRIILRNIYLMEKKSQKRHPTFSLAAGRSLDRLDQIAIPPPQEETLQFKMVMERLFLLLTPEHQEILRLSGYEGLGEKEIAVTLGLSLGTTKSRLSRARTRIRNLVEGYLETRNQDSKSRLAA